MDSSGTQVGIGAQLSGAGTALAGTYLDGDIDEVGIWDVALCDEEIAAMASAPPDYP